jgi:two-component system alkaline phosphatase synthesis response regulator PhoP
LGFGKKMNKKDIKILLVDDEPDILEFMSYNLSNEGYKVYTATNGEEAIEKAKSKSPHLILLDVMMPKMDGIEACENLRKLSKLGDKLIIVFLTARSEDYTQVAGLEAGADDYITKPVKIKVLISKVKSLLRRMQDGAYRDSLIEVGSLVVNREEYKIIYKGEEKILPRKEFELLSLLASKPNKVFEREVILDRVWGNEVIVGGRTIDVHIRKLREKIGDRHFKTVKGVGYKYVI